MASVANVEVTRRIKVHIARIRAFVEVIDGILTNESAAEHARYSSYKMMAETYNGLAAEASMILGLEEPVSRFDISQMRDPNDTLWSFQKRMLELVLLESKLLLATLEGYFEFADDEFRNLSDFIETRLRAVVFSKPDKEVDVQNALETLLIGRGMRKGENYDRESGKVEFSGKEFIPDFVVFQPKMAIEVKLLKDNTRRSSLVEQISADITGYGKVYDRILFVVYDVGCIQDELQFKRDIEAREGVKVVVVKH